MPTHTFTFVLEGVEHTDELANRLFAAGCDDALLCGQDGDVALDFDREADHQRDALVTAANDVGRAGIKIKSVEIG